MSPSIDTPMTATFTIEPGRANDLAPCECCGATPRIVRGFVYEASTARAIYLVRWPVGELHRDADVAVSIGGWCDADQSPRQLVTFSLRQLDDGPAFMIVDAGQTPWNSEEMLGEPRKRSEVLGTPLASEAFRILDAIALQDERVHGWLLDR